MLDKLLRNHAATSLVVVVASLALVACLRWRVELGIPRWAALAFGFSYVFVNLTWLVLLGKRLRRDWLT